MDLKVYCTGILLLVFAPGGRAMQQICPYTPYENGIQTSGISGTITSEDAKVKNFQYKWTFKGLPSRTSVLVLNVTLFRHLPLNTIKLFQDDLQDGKLAPFCMVLGRQGMVADLSQLHILFPKCIVQTGIQSDTQISYCARPLALGFQAYEPQFIIKYKAINFEQATTAPGIQTTSPTDITSQPSDITQSTAEASTSLGDRTTATGASKVADEGPNILLIVLLILGVLLLILITVLITILIMREKNKKNPKPSEGGPVQVIYHTIGDSNGTRRNQHQQHMNPNYEEIREGMLPPPTPPNGRTVRTPTLNGRGVTTAPSSGGESFYEIPIDTKRDVQNPLYESQLSDDDVITMVNEPERNDVQPQIVENALYQTIEAT